MKKIKNVKKYWPMVRDMSQIALLLVIGFALFWACLVKAKTPDMQFATGAGSLAAFLFSIPVMFFATAKSKLPRSK